MSGICGYLGDLNENVLMSMRDALGPSLLDSRVYENPGAAVCTLDSHTGGVANLGGHVLAYNGHIWNIDELSRTLEKVDDANPAQLLLRLLIEKGEKVLPAIQGQFALALCNPQRKEVMLARDKIGHVPLYYSTQGDFVLFASKISGIIATKLLPRVLNLTGLDYYLSFGHIPTHETLFKGVQRLPAASVVHLQNGNWRLGRYWQLEPRQNPRVTQDEWATFLHDKLHTVLLEYLSKSNPPTGVLLSGIDSSILLALLKRMVGDGLFAYTVAFEDERHNEPFAKEMAEFLGVAYREVVMTADDVPRILPQLVSAYEDLLSEHLASLPTFLLASQAARDVRTVFTGDGAGLLFSESEPQQRPSRLSYVMPRRLRETLVRYPFTSVRPRMFNQPLRALDSFLNELGMRCSTSARVYYGQIIFRPHERRMLYNEKLENEVVTNTFSPILDLVARATKEIECPEVYLPNVFRFKIRMADTWGFYIPRIQRISAHFSLVNWLPYLDERIVELVAMMPQQPASTGRTKAVLRHVASKYKLLPDQIINQRKKGMAAPLEAWMQSQLREYVEQVVEDGIETTHHLFRGYQVKKAIRNGDPRKVFAFIMLFLWLKHYFPEELDF